MKNTICLIVVMIFGFATHIIAAQHVGFIKRLSGDVGIRRGEMVVTALAGEQLFNKDILITKPNGSAGIIFTDGTTLALGPNTEFSIDNFLFEPENEAYDFSAYLKKGSALYNSGKIGKISPDAVNLSTPRATVVIRGTRFILKAE